MGHFGFKNLTSKALVEGRNAFVNRLGALEAELLRGLVHRLVGQGDIGLHIAD